MPQYDDLLQSIRGRHPHPVLLGQRVGHFFDIHIRCLGFFGVYHADAMVPFNAAGIALYLVGVKDQYQLAPPVALVVAQDLNEPVPGGVQVGFRQLGQLLPRKDDIVSIHQQIFRPFGQGRRFPRLGAIPGRLWGMQRFAAPPLDGPVGHLKNAHQLFILQKGAPVGLAALPGHGRFLRLLVCLQHIRLDMRHTGYLIPPHGVSGPSAAKDRIRRIRGIGIAVVAAGGYHFLRVAAGGIAIRFPAQPSPSAGVPQHLSRVVPQGIQRRRAPQPQQAAASNAVNAAAPAPVQRPRSPQRRSYKQHYYDASTPAVPMHICPLGGLGEVGKNITLYECQGDMILVDCGLVFPDSDMFGVDLVIPDFTYVLENKDRIKGLFITHGHEDHIGSLPYLLKKFNVPIYTARLTIGLIKNKLEEHGLASSAEFHEIRPRQKVRLGCFTVEPIHVNHSIPDSLAFAIDCPAGIVLHTGDFKIDYTPLSGDAVTDLSTIAEYGRRGVLALLADSTNAERPGFTATEQTVAEGVRSLFARAKNRRIIVATFASNIYRIQQIIDLAIEYGRKVAVNGRSMVSNTEMARELGYLHAPDNVLIDIEEINKYPPEKVVLITTGSQGEPLSALSRMAQASHRTVKVGPTDFIIISARPIPGNEKTVTKVVNGLLALGAEVIYENMYDTHVSGHACQEEQKLMLTLAHPQYFLPVHGEFKQLKRHAETAEHLGYIPKQNIYIAENGQNIRLSRDGMAVEGTVPAGAVMVDGYGVGDVGNVVLRDRHHLSEDGIIIVTAAVDGSTGQLLSGPDLVSRGFVYVRESEELMDGARVQVEMALDRSMADNMHDWASVKSRVREALSSYIYRKTKRSPMILPILMEV